MDDFDLFMFLAMNHDMMDVKLYTHTYDGHAGLSNAMLNRHPGLALDSPA